MRRAAPPSCTVTCGQTTGQGWRLPVPGRDVVIRDWRGKAEDRHCIDRSPAGQHPIDGIYQTVARRGEKAAVAVHLQRFRHHFSHTWLERGGAEGDLMELNGWVSPQMLIWYGASARGARARRSYDRIMHDTS
jgi:hypothetical protein